MAICNCVLERRFEQCPGNRKRLLPSRFLGLADSFWARWRARRTEVLIEGSSGSSGGLVGEHQPDELMRDGGRWAGRFSRLFVSVSGHKRVFDFEI